MVPHEHHGELTDQGEALLHSENECICDWLQLVFHDDLGAGHLEHFVQGEEISPVNQAISHQGNSDHFIFHTPLKPELIAPENNNLFRSNHTPQQSLYLRHPDALRGPPTCV